MPKGWKTIETVNTRKSTLTDIDRKRKQRVFDTTMRSFKTPSAYQLKQESKELCEKKEQEEEQLLQAFEDNKLKSKNAIKQALRLKKERDKKTRSKVQDNRSTNEGNTSIKEPTNESV